MMKTFFYSFIVLLLTITSCKNACDNKVCLNGGGCVEGKCICTNGYTGENCQTSPCANITCLNGGNCVSGNCSCPNGYSGTNCQVPPNPCAGITCLNGGSCANGVCNCPQGYSGGDCSQQVTPSKIIVTKIEVTRFPATTTNGGGWDIVPPSGPDIYPAIYDGSTKVYESATYSENANQGVIYSFTPSSQLVLNHAIQYSIRLYDYDGGLNPGDLMGSITFTPYNSSNNFPAIRVVDGGGSVAFKLHLTYQW